MAKSLTPWSALSKEEREKRMAMRPYYLFFDFRCEDTDDLVLLYSATLLADMFELENRDKNGWVR